MLIGTYTAKDLTFDAVVYWFRTLGFWMTLRALYHCFFGKPITLVELLMGIERCRHD